MLCWGWLGCKKTGGRKKSGKKIKKQQQFFADGFFVENLISAYAINTERKRKAKNPSENLCFQLVKALKSAS